MSPAEQPVADLSSPQLSGPWRAVAFVAIGLLGTAAGGYALVAGWSRPEPSRPRESIEATSPPKSPAPEPPRNAFVDVTAESGIDFVHCNGAYGEKIFPESMGAGVAVFDFDNDGDQDLLFVNGSHWPWRPPSDETLPTMRLFRNDGNWRFADATPGSGLDCTFYGQGAAAGDIDNDGWVDLFITAVGPNHLFKNEAGRFIEVTERAGVAGGEEPWSTSSGFFDLENDGDLDLFVCNYVEWSKDFDLSLAEGLHGAPRIYGPPHMFDGTFAYLYRNEGGGRFRDISAASGVQVRHPITKMPRGMGLGVCPVDLDDDGYLDLVVANDTVPNFVLHNRRDGTFREIGIESGIAYNSSGDPRGAMGIDAGHVREDATLAVAIGNFANEMTALYVSGERPLEFADDATAAGIGVPTRSALTFGLFFFDYDLDGRLDLFEVNGHLEPDIQLKQPSQTYAQPPLLFWNAGPGSTPEFVPIDADHGGTDLSAPIVGRGAAYGDLDGDGDLDIVITSTGASPRLLRNDQPRENHWLRLKLVGKSSNRDAIGAKIELHRGSSVQRRTVMPTKSYLSQCELTVTFGLGQSDRLDRLLIRWPNGAVQPVEVEEVDRLLVIEQE